MKVEPTDAGESNVSPHTAPTVKAEPPDTDHDMESCIKSGMSVEKHPLDIDGDDVYSDVKNEPADADDVCSSEVASSAEPAGAEGSPAAATVKQEMDIGPTRLQPMDIQLMLRPCKPETTVDNQSDSETSCSRTQDTRVEIKSRIDGERQFTRDGAGRLDYPPECTDGRRYRCDMYTADMESYAVIQFLEPPSGTVDSYVSVPHSWLKARGATDQRVTVVYPRENPNLTKRRVMRGHKPSERWQPYSAIVKYDTHSFEDAETFITARKNDETIDMSPAGEKQSDELSLTVKKKSLRFRKKTSRNQKISKSQTAKPYKSLQKPMKGTCLTLPSASGPHCSAYQNQSRIKGPHPANLLQNISRSSECLGTNKTATNLVSSADVRSSEQNETLKTSENASAQKLVRRGITTTSSILNKSTGNVNQFCQSNPSLNKDQFSSDNRNHLKDPQRQRAVLEYSSEVDAIVNQPSTQSNVTNLASSVQNSLNSTNQPSQLLKHMREQQHLFTQQVYSPQGFCSRETTGNVSKGQCIDNSAFSQSIANITSSSVNDLGNRCYDIFKQSQDALVIPAYQSYLEQMDRTKEFLERSIGESRSQSAFATQHLLNVVPSQQLYTYTPPVNRDDMHRNQLNQGILGVRSAIVTDSDYRPSLQSSDPNRQFVAQQASNLSNVYRNNLDGKQLPSLYQDNSQVSTMQKVPCITQSRVDSAMQSTSSIRNSQKKQCPLVPGQSHQNQCMQQGIVGKCSQENYIQQNSHFANIARNIASGSLSSLNEAGQSGQQVECSMGERLSPEYEAAPVHESFTQDEEMDLVNSNEQSNMDVSNTEGNPTTSPIFSGSTNELNNFKITEQDFLSDLVDLFNKFNKNHSKMRDLFDRLHSSFNKSAAMMEQATKTMDNDYNLRTRRAKSSTSEKVTAEVQSVTENEQNASKEKDNSDTEIDDDQDDGSDDDYENYDVVDDDNDFDYKDDDEENDDGSRNKSHRQIRTFILPSEYDPADSRWTLKYRDPGSGLVELIPGCGVFINAIKLAHCKRVSKDPKILARIILPEIFSQAALSVCSLTGARANAFTTKDSNVRPGLDEHARTVLMSFIELHSQEMRWSDFNKTNVINSIRSKIQDIRAKYGQTA